jgi:hypothetical protein
MLTSSSAADAQLWLPRVHTQEYCVQHPLREPLQWRGHVVYRGAELFRARLCGLNLGIRLADALNLFVHSFLCVLFVCTFWV